jgi:transcriptional regulator with XRE-family HTH domain
MQEEKQEKKEKLLAFSERLKRLTGRQGLKQKAIATALGEGSSTVGQWFRGKNFPGPSVEYRLADLLGVPRDWLIEGKVEKGENEVMTMTLRDEESKYQARLISIAHLESLTRRCFETIMDAAGEDPKRLGWVHEQLIAHLTPPKHWQDEAQDEAQEVAKAKNLLQAVKDEAATDRTNRGLKDQAS